MSKNRFQIDDMVDLHGNIGRVVAITDQPAVQVKFGSGNVVMVGQSVLKPATDVIESAREKLRGYDMELLDGDSWPRIMEGLLQMIDRDRC